MTAQLKNDQAPNPLWGGRFAEGASDLLTEINSTVHVDVRLIEQDVAGSIAHAEMLGAQGVLSATEAGAIVEGLGTVLSECRSGDFVLDPQLEDVHMNVEFRLQQLLGADVAGKLHTGRSRNDQVAVDSKMWVRSALERLDDRTRTLVLTLVRLAEQHHADPMPGFTHLQNAQPVTIGHHLLAYAEMLTRDRDRLSDAHRRTSASPLGAAALAGTSHPIDSARTARSLGFASVMRNSIDAVSDRDFMLDLLTSGSVLAVHMSRMAEEIVHWSTPQFGYVRLPDGLTAGSSIMPQKQNPDAAELVRAKSGRVIGDLVALLTVLKGLPLAYSRDMQEDKEALFDAVDTLDVCLRTLDAVFAGITFDTRRTREDAAAGNTLATDLADWLVTERGASFRIAHHTVGTLVKTLDDQGRDLRYVTAADLAAMDAAFDGMPADRLSVEAAVARRTSEGGTAPARVRAAAAQLRELNETRLSHDAEGGGA